MTGKHKVSRRKALMAVGSVISVVTAGCLNETTHQVPSYPKKEPTQFQYDAQNTGVTGMSGPTNKTLRWKRSRSELDTETTQIRGLAVVEDRLLVTTTDELHVLDTADGSELWATQPGEGGGKPAATVDTAYVVWRQNDTAGISALSLTDGAEQWRSTPVGDVTAAPTLLDDTLYVSVVKDEEFAPGAILALDTEDGTEQWRFEDTEGAPAPAVADGTVYVSGGKQDGSVYALDAETGEKQWEITTRGRKENAPTVVDETVYIPNQAEEKLTARDASDGTERWTVEISVTASVAATTETVYVPTRDGIQALDTAGDTRWTHAADSEFRGYPPVVAGKTLLVTGSKALCLNTSDGSTHWEQSIKRGTLDDVVVKRTSCEPVTDGSTVFIGTAAGDLYAIGE